MTLEQEYGLNAGLNRRRGFFRRLTLKKVVKGAIAPHSLLNKKIQKKVIKGALAPHSLLIKKKKR